MQISLKLQCFNHLSWFTGWFQLSIKRLCFFQQGQHHFGQLLFNVAREHKPSRSVNTLKPNNLVCTCLHNGLPPCKKLKRLNPIPHLCESRWHVLHFTKMGFKFSFFKPRFPSNILSCYEFPPTMNQPPLRTPDPGSGWTVSVPRSWCLNNSGW